MIARLDHSNGASVSWSSLSSLGYLLSIILNIVFSPQLLLIFRRWRIQNNTKDLTDTPFVINRMSTAVIFLKERRYHDNYFLVVGELAKYILQPYEETQNQELRQKYGDHLSNGNALYFLATFLSRLLNEDIASRGCWLGICVVLSIFWFFSVASSKLARRSLLDVLGKGLDGNSIKCSTKEVR